MKLHEFFLNFFYDLELSNIGLDSNKGHILLDLLTSGFQNQENSNAIYTVFMTLCTIFGIVMINYLD